MAGETNDGWIGARISLAGIRLTTLTVHSHLKIADDAFAFDNAFVFDNADDAFAFATMHWLDKYWRYIRI